MATSPIQREQPGAQGFRRSFTLPARSLSFHEQAALNKTDAKAEVLYSHPRARIFSFTPPTESIRTSSKAEIPDDTDYPVDTIETLPWRSRTEVLAATGQMLIEKVRGSTNFLKCQDIMHAILRNSQCWCVDGESKFVLRVRKFQYYRIELPTSTEEDKKKVEELKHMLPTVLRYERTPCPFIRAFQVDLPDDAITPRRKGQWKRRDSSQPGTPEQESPTVRVSSNSRSWSTRTPPSAYPRNGPSYNMPGSVERPGNSTGFVRRHSLLSSQESLEHREGTAAPISYELEEQESELDSNEDIDTDASEEGDTKHDTRGRQTNIVHKETRSLSVSARVAAFETVRADSQTRPPPARELSRTRTFSIQSPAIERENPAKAQFDLANSRDKQGSVTTKQKSPEIVPVERIEQADLKLLQQNDHIREKPPSPMIISASTMPQARQSYTSNMSESGDEDTDEGVPSNLQLEMEQPPVLTSSETASIGSETLNHTDAAQQTFSSKDQEVTDLPSERSDKLSIVDDSLETYTMSASSSVSDIEKEVALEPELEPESDLSSALSPETELQPESDFESQQEREQTPEPEPYIPADADADALSASTSRNSSIPDERLTLANDHQEADKEPDQSANSVAIQMSSLSLDQEKAVPSPDKSTGVEKDLDVETDHVSDVDVSTPAKEDLDDSLSTISSVDSFHTLTSDAMQSQSNFKSEMVHHSSAEQSDPFSYATSQHRRDLSDMTVTAASFHEATAYDAETPLARSVHDWQATSQDSETVPQPETSELRHRGVHRRSSSPLPPESTLFTGSNTSPWQDTSHHLTKAILEKAIIKPIEVMVLVIHILSRIASGATVNDLLSGELFRKPEHRRRVSGFADQSTSINNDEDVEDDYGLPIREGRKRARLVDGNTGRSKDESLGTNSSTSID